MMLKERVMGVLNLSSREPRYFTSRHAALALGIANQAAIAIPSASFPGHLGLHSMRERVANLGGTFQIESTAGAGTRVCVSIPT